MDIDIGNQGTQARKALDHMLIRSSRQSMKNFICFTTFSHPTSFHGELVQLLYSMVFMLQYLNWRNLQLRLAQRINAFLIVTRSDCTFNSPSNIRICNNAPVINNEISPID